MKFGKHGNRRHAKRGMSPEMAEALGSEHRRGRGRGSRNRRPRLFNPGELQILLLSLIGEEPRHGYDLIREIEARSQGGYAPSPGVVYPALTFMEEAGLIAVADDGGQRKSYAITEEGRAKIADQADVISSIEARLKSLADVRERTDAAPVRRAMQNLKTAVFNRLSEEDVSRETVLQVADLIDDAAKQIERIEA